MNENDIPVYLFTGFLESGKTKFIQETLCDERFNKGEKTLLLVCEEGVEEKWLRKEEKIYTRIHKYPSECKGEDLFRQMIDNKEYITSVPIQLVTREFLEDNSLMFYEGIIHEDELFVFKCLLLAIRAGYIDNTFDEIEC